MATPARLPTSLAQLFDHLLRPSRPPLTLRRSGFNSGTGHLDLLENRTGLHRASSPGASSSSGDFGRPRRNGCARSARRIHCSASNSGIASTGVALKSREDTRSEPRLVHVLESNFHPATPLCERPGTSIASLIEVCRWRNQARELATLVGSEFVDADGGPEVSDLLRELEWLLDDAVAGCASGSGNASGQTIAWKACAWRDIKALQIVELESGNSVVASGAREDLTDVPAIYGAFGVLCKERHTDPVNEFAADCGCSCDGIRESLAEMASSYVLSTETQARMESISLLDSTSDQVQQRGQGRRNAKAGLQLLLRMSIAELDKAWKERIQKRRPFQYVVAAAHWREYVLGVVEGVLIPRPETEQIVDLVEAAISADKSLGQGLWADLGTGSGAIAIAVAHLLGPTGSVVAIDASSASVLVAKRNVERYSLQNSVKVQQGLWFSPLQDKVGVLAGVVSNPPYIPSDRLTGLQAEVGKHEPRIALDGGPDGMSDLREICRGSATALRQGGFLALETDGAEQAAVLCDLLSSMRVLWSRGMPLRCFQNVKSVKDFSGITRFVTAIRC